MIKISEEIYFSEKGKRDNNEDNCGWNSELAYIVCDGVGGHERGEIASEIVVQTFLNFNSNDSVLPIEKTLLIAEGRIAQYIQKNPESKGMGTTLTIAQIQDNSINVAWVGDSRIYQFRNGQLLFQSRDHSWVNQAVDAGIITEEEAVDHPKSNIITRAIQGSHSPTKAQEFLVSDIQKEDIFLLCSDGVLETWSNEDFIALFSSESNLSVISEKIKNECSLSSRDNFTGVLFKIDSIDHVVKKETKRKVTIPNEYSQVNLDLNENNATIKTGNNKRFIIYLILSVLIVLGLVLYFFPSDSTSVNKNTPEPRINKENKIIKDKSENKKNKEEKSEEEIVEPNQEEIKKPEEKKNLTEPKTDEIKEEPKTDKKISN
jgi:serine/threonine protein phosphatase PrpC